MNINMSLSNRQVQSLTITAEMIQSIKLLQCSQEELWSYLTEQAERNPLIEISGFGVSSARSARVQVGAGSVSDKTPTAASAGKASTEGRMRGTSSGAGARVDDERPGLESYVAARTTLQEHLRGQLGSAFRHPADRMIALEIIGSLDEDGYLRRNLVLIADALNTSEERTERVLKQIQRMDPVGVGARNLTECLKVQFEDAGRLTDKMEILLDNLPLLANFDYVQLASLCKTGKEDVLAMAQEIRKLDPRPGRRFDNDPVLPALPDVSVTIKADGTLVTELNTGFLPRVLVNRQYYSEIKSKCHKAEDARFITDCMQNASWLAKNVDQRAKTLLKVATEIVARQQEFFLHGVEHLKPLNLKDVAEAVGVHQSTVCRAIANKFVMTARGMYELKYFFANAISATGEGEERSADTVRHMIRQMIADETEKTVLSDDAIVKALQDSGIDIARRTVAKYRDGMNIPSSLQRRRRLAAAGFKTSSANGVQIAA